MNLYRSLRNILNNPHALLIQWRYKLLYFLFVALFNAQPSSAGHEGSIKVESKNYSLIMLISPRSWNFHIIRNFPWRLTAPGNLARLIKRK